ncbi:putative Pentatricopeptide repeat-containing protein [Abeliophyllum distichum]|uniref:Pentatricopeptide repeat-containing protein n=1 Tax=Abeliophyllum distichum TaxID=126358 RepID=A0ABD1QJG7_9LAMI
MTLTRKPSISSSGKFSDQSEDLKNFAVQTPMIGCGYGISTLGYANTFSSTRQLAFDFRAPLAFYSQVNFPQSGIVPNRNSNSQIENEAVKIQALLKLQSHKSVEDIHQSLAQCNLSLSEELVFNVLKRHRSDWKVAYAFFVWVCKVNDSNGFFPNTCIFNEILDTLGRMKRFGELSQVLDEMSKRKNLIDEGTYGVVIHRYAAAHKVEEAVEFFYKRKEFGLQQELIAFQTLLLSLCRYKHVEAAELLFHNKRSESRDDIKTWNIILNGWCVLGSLPDAKRFWKVIVASKCKPDIFTYGIFINALSKSGKISTAVKLFMSMSEKGCRPDVAICNCIIDGLCFKKRIPGGTCNFPRDE